MSVTLPEDRLIEQYTIGCMMIDFNALNYCIETLEENDFYHGDYKVLFSIFKEMYTKDAQVNPENVHVKLLVMGIKDYKVWDLHSLADMSRGIDYEFYCSEVKKLSIQRRIIHSCSVGMNDAADKKKDPMNVIIDIHRNLDLSAGNHFSKTKTMNEIISNIRDGRSLAENALWKKKRRDSGVTNFEGVCSGYPILDETLGSFQKGALYYVGARSSMGKTTFLLNLIVNMLNKHKIGFFSLEMEENIVAQKLVCILTDIKYNWLSKGQLTQTQIDTLFEYQEPLKKSPLFIEGPSAMNIQILSSRAKRMKASHDIDILFIDYLTRIKTSGKGFNKHLEVDEISKGLQHLAKELNIPIVCMAQLNRASASKTKDGKVLPPTLVDFRESGSIEEDCDGAILLHRPEYYNKLDNPGQIQVIVAKNRIEGTLENIAFSCEAMKSEKYHECRRIDDIMNEIRAKEEIKQINEYWGSND